MGEKITLAQTIAFLKEQDDFLLFTHVRPDGDTIGSAVALCLSLRAIGKTAYLMENPGLTNSTRPYVEGTSAPQGYVAKTLVTIDMAARDMFPEGQEQYQDKMDLTIDHHASQTCYAKQTLVDSKAAACGEIIYLICKELAPLTSQIATALYVAVSTDTGGFIHGNTTATTHRIAADLMDVGINATLLNKRHFKTKSYVRLQLESELVQGMEAYDNGSIVMTFVTMKMMEKHHATESDVEDLSTISASVEGATACVTLRELKQDTWKLSLRTDETVVNASKVCQSMGGGGHAAAAGATLTGSLQAVKEQILTAIRQTRI